MLLHLPEAIRRFGPPILFATEKFESYNSILRTASIHSNRQSPSRDLAITFSNYQTIRLILSGAYLYDHETQEYFQASLHVTNIFSQNEVIQKSMGYNSHLVEQGPFRPTLILDQVEQCDQINIPSALKRVNPPVRLRQVASIKLNLKEKIYKGVFVMVNLLLQKTLK
jgi:hypothetical protein